MKEISFTVRGHPQGKERPRFSNGHTPHTPAKTREYETCVQWGFRIAHGQMLTGPVTAHITAAFATKSGDERGMIGCAYTKKPDCDNIAKIVLDALNGLAYPDDAFVSALHISKMYGNEDEVRIVLTSGE